MVSIKNVFALLSMLVLMGADGLFLSSPLNAAVNKQHKAGKRKPSKKKKGVPAAAKPAARKAPLRQRAFDVAKPSPRKAPPRLRAKVNKKAGRRKPRRLKKRRVKKKLAGKKRKKRLPKKVRKKGKKKVVPKKRKAKKQPPKHIGAQVPQRPPQKPQAPPAWQPPAMKPIKIDTATCHGWEREINQNTVLKQVHVFPQFGPQGGGGASCGYHALKNAMLLMQNYAHPTATICNELQDPGLVAQLFGPVGEWRERIMQHRIKQVLSTVIGQQLRNLIRPEVLQRFNVLAQEGSTVLYKAGKQRRDDLNFYLHLNAYQDKLRTIARRWAQDIVDNKVEKQITRQAIIDELARDERYSIDMTYFPLPLRKRLFYSDAAWRVHIENNILHLRDNATIDALLNLEGIDQKNIMFNMTAQAIAQAFEIYNQTAPVSIGSLNGDWVNDAELEHVITAKRAGIITTDNLTIIQDVFNLEISSDKETIETQAAVLATRCAYTHAFLLGTMDVISGTYGHWFTVVVHQKVGGHCEVVIADSLNEYLINDERVMRLLSDLKII